MTRKILGLAVVVMAISLSAFSTHVGKTKEAKFGTYYWFPVDEASGVPQTAGQLIYQSSDPWSCSFLGMGGYCVSAWTGYTQDQYGYHAAGYEVALHYYPQ
jgi:hypothetical protein